MKLYTQGRSLGILVSLLLQSVFGTTTLLASFSDSTTELTLKYTAEIQEAHSFSLIAGTPQRLRGSDLVEGSLEIRFQNIDKLRIAAKSNASAHDALLQIERCVSLATTATPNVRVFKINMQGRPLNELPFTLTIVGDKNVRGKVNLATLDLAKLDASDFELIKSKLICTILVP